MKATPVSDLEETYWNDESDVKLPARGSFEIKTNPSSGQRQFHFICPGCASFGILAIRPVVDGSLQSWEFNGNVDAPTLQPSINHVGCWHGWLTDGEFRQC